MSRKLSTVAALFVCLVTLNGCVLLAVGAAGGAAGGTITSSESPGYQPMTYVGTVLGNILYFPAKAIFAGGGAVVSGASYVFTGGDEKVSSHIWNTSTGGDYLLTPAMIAGEKPVHFAG